MKIYSHIVRITCAIALLFAIACSQDDFYLNDSNGDTVYVKFTPSLNDGISSRAVFGDASGVTHLTAVVYYEINGQVASEPVLRKEFNLQEAISNGFELRLMAEKNYKIIFWAQHESKPYTIADNGIVTTDYSDFETTTIESIEQHDAFYAVKSLSINSQSYTDETPIVLSRPLGKLSLLDKVQPIDETHVTTVTYYDIPKGFNPFTASATNETISELSFTFDEFTDQHITIENTPHYYVATNYLFVPSDNKIRGNIKVVEDEVTNSDKPFEVELIPNYQVVLRDKDGSIVESPNSGTVWDGVIPIEFPFATLDEQNRYVIDEEGDIAWLSVASNAMTLDDNSTFIVTTNLNMGGNELSPIQLPAGSTFDGGDYTIKGLKLQNGLFADNSTEITIKNLKIDNSIIENNSGTETHVGALFNTLKSSNTISNVHVTNTSVKTVNGAAGGIVGYVARSTENNRALTISVELDNCSVTNTTISGTESEGYFVGMLSGYDNNETLTFNANCVSNGNRLTKLSLYTDNNKAAWLSEDFTTFNQWLGKEKYYRGTVNYGTIRFIPKWDGTTTIEPLLANATYDSGTTAGGNRYVVYSPFDLAGVRKKTASPAAIYLRADVDMNGQGEDGKYKVPENFTQSKQESTDDNVFNPFSYVTTLDGQKDANTNYSIYNLCIQQLEQERAAFILYASSTTTHKNINFRNCQTVAVHKDVPTDAKAYGAILVSNVDATYTMENVHAWDCKVFALQKVGTLGARINGTSKLTNNTVNNCYVENYECDISELFDSGTKEMAGVTARVYAKFEPHGEVGGMYGFIQGTSTLTNCKVNGTKIYAFGQDDERATIEGNGFVQAVIAALGYYYVPGRHVGRLIGDIRATGKITLSGCTVDDATKCTKRCDKHEWRVQTGTSGSWLNPTPIYTYYKQAEIIGQAYYVEFLDSKGSVTFDGQAITLNDCKKETLYYGDNVK